MPIYEYRCESGHSTDLIRRYVDRDDAVTCHCGLETKRLPPLPHCLPDGMYSYAPNIGSAQAFEARRHAIREGVKVIPKQDQPKVDY